MKWALLILPALALVCGCGPEETSLDRYNQQIQTIVDEREALYAPLAGKYVGTLVKETGGTAWVEIDLSSMVVLQPNPSQDQPSKVPILVGSLNLCTKGDACFKPGDDDTFVAPLAQFTGGDYDPQTKKLQLYSGGANAAGTSNNAGGAPLVSLNGTLDGDHLTGVISTTLRQNVGTIDLTKTH